MTKRTNQTVLGVASIRRTLPVVGAVLIGLFVFIRPEASAGLGFVERVVFWSVHIGLGLAGISLASVLLRPALGQSVPLWMAVLLTGLLGAAVLAPMYVLVETWLPLGPAEEPDDWLDRLALEGPLQSVLAEYIEVMPMYLLAWLAVNLPLLFGKPVVHDSPNGDSGDDTEPGGGSGDGPADADDNVVTVVPDLAQEFYDTLPRAIGTDVIAVSSDLHYLHVHTAAGKCMVLGSLARAAQSLGEQGMLVHRSHWIAHRHVVRIIKQSGKWDCLMSNDMRVPVSRRKRAGVNKLLGSGAVVGTAERRSTVSVGR